MPLRVAPRPARREGPPPFSSEWIKAPPTPAPPRRTLVLPSWFPDERVLSAALVLLLAAGIALAAGDGGPRRPPVGADAAQVGAGESLSAPAPPPAAAAVTATVGPTATAVPTPPPTPTPTYVPAPAFGGLDEASVGGAAGGALLPTYRILTYYGHPHDPNMGILGEHPIDELHALLLAEAANYEAADPSRPVIPAFEVIATVAQTVPGADGTYILDTDHPTIREYVDYAAAHDMLVFLDLQIGRGTVAAEIEKVRPLLERPHVHLALDPEFAVAEGEIPGEHIGSLGAESIRYAQETLAALAAEHGLPPKILIVHQFREDMIAGKESLVPVPGVQLVIDADGYGVPILKIDVYNILVRDQFIEFGGIKLFYKQDKPLMTPAEVLALNPPPDVVIYQ